MERSRLRGTSKTCSRIFFSVCWKLGSGWEHCKGSSYKEKLFELMLHLLLIEILQLINLQISKMLKRVKISLEIN